MKPAAKDGCGRMRTGMSVIHLLPDTGDKQALK